MNRHLFRSLFLFMMSLSSCTVGPDYRTPDLPLPATWSEAAQSEEQPQAADLIQWWTTFRDPVLNTLVERAVRTNLDLREAVSRVIEARGSLGATKSERWPMVDLLGSYSRLRQSENTSTSSTFASGSGGLLGERPSGSLESELFQTNFDTSWELDLFGRVRRSVEAAAADLAAAEEDRRDVLVSLLAEVASNYVELRGAQRQLTVTRNNIAAQQQTVELTQARFEAGLTSALDVAEAEAQLATTQAQVPTLEISLKKTIHRLGVLLGQEPGSLLVELSPEQPIPTAPLDVIVGLPSDLLRRRPDIRKAERELAAATARIGVATADLFPSFSLNSNTLGFQSASLSDLALASSRFWTVGPTVSWPFFDAGRIRANIQIKTALQEQTLAQYEKTVLTSLEEVENALVAYAREQARQRALAEAVEANQRALSLANERYIRGLGDFLNVLEAQKALYNTEDKLVQSERTVVTNLIALYKALGGGWESSS